MTYTFGSANVITSDNATAGFVPDL